jgi:hypothetical protein
MSPWIRASGLLNATPAIVLAFVAGCSDTEPVTSVAPPVSLSANRGEPAVQLAACGTSASTSASAEIGPDGGVLSAGPATVFIPPYAVRTPTRFTVQPLAGRSLRVRITAKGRARFGFAQPIAVMIGYAHCQRQEFLHGNLSVWQVDDDTNVLLERMPTVHDRRNATLGFLTAHLSTYAVAH